jgi:ABC-2 type transport system ATP-binding protein
MSGDAVTLAGVTKRYGDVTAVDSVSLHVAPGEIYALLGLNGAGKTTLIRLLLGMVRPTAGDVTVLGEPIRRGTRTVWSRVGYLVETSSAYPELTVRENLLLQARLHRLGGRRGAVDDVIEALALVPYTDRRARTLSLGNAQRLGLAKALLHRPELLVLDEPSNGLDPAGVVEIRELIRGLGVTVLLSSHVLGEVARVATRIGIIHHGQLVRELDAADLAAALRRRLSVSTRDLPAAAELLRRAGYRPRQDDNGLVLDDGRVVDAPDAVAALLAAAGHPPTRLLVEQDDLETYFLRTVGGDDA